MTMLEALETVAAGGSLTRDQAHTVMGLIMDGGATPAQVGALLMGLRLRGETVDEVTGFALAMREHATHVQCQRTPLVDTCGTGGDGLGTFNISTTAAFVAAGAGAVVAKHGNRAASSHCGSADVLAELGVRLDLAPDDVARCVDDIGIGFLFAQALHPAMKHAAGPRRELGVRTVFNILGPLSNPAGATRQVLGVGSASLMALVAEVSAALGTVRAFVVHGGGMDEITTLGPTTVVEVRDGMTRQYDLCPEDLGLAPATLMDLAGGTPAENADILLRVLSGEPGPRRDVVLLNAAAAIAAADLASSLAEAVPIAQESIDSGAALAKLEALRRFAAP